MEEGDVVGETFMNRWDRGLLGSQQAAFVVDQYASVVLIEDLSWGLTDTRVLHVEADGREMIVKAAGTRNKHIGREITGRQHVPVAFLDRGTVGAVLAADRELNVVVVEYLQGELVEGTEAEYDPEVHRQAGALLAKIHEEPVPADMDYPDYESRMTAKTLTLLDRDHRISASTVGTVRRVLADSARRTTPTAPGHRVLTHGDWQPRNWLIDGATLKIIDFGRFDVRSAESDLGRLAVQQWRGRPDLEQAFLEGYGSAPRDPRTWAVNQIREAVGTAVWAREVGDRAFEQQGHRMLAEALDLY